MRYGSAIRPSVGLRAGRWRAHLPGLAAVTLVCPGLLRAAPADGTAPPGVLKAFAEHCAERVRTAEKARAIAVLGRENWLFPRTELRHVAAGRFWGADAARAARTTRAERADPLPVILGFHAQLAAGGIRLVLVPVPPKAFVYPELLKDGVPVDRKTRLPPRLDVHHRGFYGLLRRKGVTVIDLLPEFLAHRFDREGAVFCRQDSHWSGRGCRLAARLVAEEIRRHAWVKRTPKTRFGHEERTVLMHGDLSRAAPGLPKERLTLRFVGRPSRSGLAPVRPDRTSPVLVLADSHGLIFHAGGDMGASGAGLPDQLALELGFAVDLLAARGEEVTQVRLNLRRRAIVDRRYLGRKKVVVWCFAARCFTEALGGWRKIPLSK